MSLYVGALAFPGEALMQTQVRLGVIGGSLLSLAAGGLVLTVAAARKRSRQVDVAAPVTASSH
jgi:NhaA family Na+:H+ antiporter